METFEKFVIEEYGEEKGNRLIDIQDKISEEGDKIKDYTDEEIQELFEKFDPDKEFLQALDEYDAYYQENRTS